MTDQDAMLKLALAVYPSPSVVADGIRLPTVFYKGFNGDMPELFDPANNDTQAVAVMCWLLGHDHNNAVTHDSIFYVVEDGTGWSKRAEYYDNTPASFRAAVTKAALRVVQG